MIVRVFPNPVKDVVSLQFTNFAKGNYQARIADVSGKIVQASVLNISLPFQQQAG
jgi:hypothetical protein